MTFDAVMKCFNEINSPLTQLIDNFALGIVESATNFADLLPIFYVSFSIPASYY